MNFSPLFLRIVSSLIMAPIALAAIFAGGWYFMAFVIAGLLISVYEWFQFSAKMTRTTWHQTVGGLYLTFCFACFIFLRFAFEEGAWLTLSLILAAALVGERLSAATQAQLGQILSASHFWLRRFPSKYSSANNHRIAELAGLYLIGLSRGAEPADIRAELIAETFKQILPDGAGAEQDDQFGVRYADTDVVIGIVRSTIVVADEEGDARRADQHFFDIIGGAKQAVRAGGLV